MGNGNSRIKAATSAAASSAGSPLERACNRGAPPGGGTAAGGFGGADGVAGAGLGADAAGIWTGADSGGVVGSAGGFGRVGTGVPRIAGGSVGGSAAPAPLGASRSQTGSVGSITGSTFNDAANSARKSARGSGTSGIEVPKPCVTSCGGCGRAGGAGDRGTCSAPAAAVVWALAGGADAAPSRTTKGSGAGARAGVAAGRCGSLGIPNDGSAATGSRSMWIGFACAVAGGFTSSIG